MGFETIVLIKAVLQCCVKAGVRTMKGEHERKWGSKTYVVWTRVS